MPAIDQPPTSCQTSDANASVQDQLFGSGSLWADRQALAGTCPKSDAPSAGGGACGGGGCSGGGGGDLQSMLSNIPIVGLVTGALQKLIA
jgi:hypothetical protein